MSINNPYEAPQSSLSNYNNDCEPIFNPFAASCFAILFSTPFACILHAMNWKKLGNEEMAKANWIACIAIIVISFILIAFASNIVINLFSIASLLVWYFLLGSKQQKFVKENYGNDYPRRNIWMAALAGLGFVSLYVILLTIVMVAFGNVPIETVPVE